MFDPPMWREFIQSLGVAAEFTEPATDEAIAQAEQKLGVGLPDDLAALLRESNGVTGEYGLGVIWPVERIASDNALFRASFRDVYMPFEGLLFFADAGNGDQFVFPLRSGGAA
jgi:cell wall assembly regulator SMI1